MSFKQSSQNPQTIVIQHSSTHSPDTDKSHLAEIPLSSKRIFESHVICLRSDEAKLPSGKIAERVVVEHPGGVVALPILDDGRIILVEQFRYAPGAPMLELPAGKLDPGEDPLEAIKRELIEETGYMAENWEELSVVYTSPGFCNEKLWLYKATGLKPVSGPIHKPDDEFIDLYCLHPDDVLAKIKKREIVDAKTLCLMMLAFM